LLFSSALIARVRIAADSDSFPKAAPRAETGWCSVTWWDSRYCAQDIDADINEWMSRLMSRAAIDASDSPASSPTPAPTVAVTGFTGNKCFGEWDWCNDDPNERVRAYWWEAGWCAAAIEAGALKEKTIAECTSTPDDDPVPTPTPTVEPAPRIKPKSLPRPPPTPTDTPAPTPTENPMLDLSRIRQRCSNVDELEEVLENGFIPHAMLPDETEDDWFSQDEVETVKLWWDLHHCDDIIETD
jgi:hypothetical protein